MREEGEGVNEGEAGFEAETLRVLETGGDGGFSATPLEEVLTWSPRVNKIAGDVVVDPSNNVLI